MAKLKSGNWVLVYKMLNKLGDYTADNDLIFMWYFFSVAWLKTQPWNVYLSCRFRVLHKSYFVVAADHSVMEGGAMRGRGMGGFHLQYLKTTLFCLN